MTGERAERFVVFNLRLLAASFALVGFFFVAWPDGTLARLTELGGHLGDFAEPPETDQRLWLSLGFAYMVVITGICLLALAGGKAASSLTSLIFFAQDDVFAYLLNGIVDGSLVFVSLLLWSLAGRIGPPPAPG
jgi:hypothetical protein